MTKVSIYGGIGTIFKIQSTLVVIAVGGLFLWQSVELSQTLIGLTCFNAVRKLKMIVSLDSLEEEHDEKAGWWASWRGVLRKLVTFFCATSGLRHFTGSNIYGLFSRRSHSIESIDINAIKSSPDSIDVENNSVAKMSDERLDLSGSLSAWQQMLA